MPGIAVCGPCSLSMCPVPSDALKRRLGPSEGVTMTDTQTLSLLADFAAGRRPLSLAQVRELEEAGLVAGYLVPRPEGGVAVTEQGRAAIAKGHA